MSIHKLKLCGTNTEFNGVQAYLKGNSRFLSLGLIGEAKTCQTISMAPDSYINEL